ncbi:MAG: tetratricopeptide repeat protein [Chitinophagaceae bacterium]
MKSVKATLMVAFIILTGGLTYLGLNSNKADIDFKAIEAKNAAEMRTQTEAEFENVLKNIGNSTSVVKPEILQSTDTAKLSLSIQLLDTMKQYIYAGVLSERLAGIQKSAYRYHMAARYFLLATEDHKNELMLFKKAKGNLESSLQMEPENLDAKVDLAVSIYNINGWQKPENQAELMRPALLLREVVKSNPDHIDGLYYLGKLAIESNQLEKAIERFKKLVSLQPQNREYYMELSGIYRMMGNETESKAWADKASAIK